MKGRWEGTWIPEEVRRSQDGAHPETLRDRGWPWSCQVGFVVNVCLSGALAEGDGPRVARTTEGEAETDSIGAPVLTPPLFVPSSRSQRRGLPRTLVAVSRQPASTVACATPRLSSQVKVLVKGHSHISGKTGVYF